MGFTIAICCNKHAIIVSDQGT